MTIFTFSLDRYLLVCIITKQSRHLSMYVTESCAELGELGGLMCKLTRHVDLFASHLRP